MTTNARFLVRAIAAIALTSCATAFAAPPAATPTAPDAAQAAYKKQVASCNDGSSNEDRATCLKEAGAALAEARKGKLDTPDKNYKQNATERCDALTGDDKDACMARMKGKGVTTEGSVESGGVLREMRTTTTQPASSAR